MFTTPCFIRKNNQYLREKIQEIGYIHGKPSNYNDDDNVYDFIICFENKYCLLSQCNYTIREGHPLKKYGSIDCGTNEALFLAIAALRDDSDINQYFVNEVRMGSINYPESVIEKGNLIKCLVDKWNYPKNDWDSMGIPSHKATVDELKERFKE